MGFARVTRKSLPLMALLTLLICLFSTAGADALPDWMLREGGIYHAIALQDGSAVYLDAVVVGKIEASAQPAYFTIHDPFTKNDPEGNLVVLTPPPPELRPGQTIDMQGATTTLPNGYRAVTDVTVWAYTDEKGNILTRGPLIKGLLAPTHWDWMEDITVQQRGFLSEPISPTSDEPNSAPRPGPVLYPRISDAQGAMQTMGAGDFLGLAMFESKPIVSKGSGYFVMGEDTVPVRSRCTAAHP